MEGTEQHMAVIPEIRVIFKSMCIYAQSMLKILDSKMWLLS